MPVGISIHAPRVGRDVSVLTTGLSIVAISIHAPRVGRDAPTRRPFDRCGRYFNPRAPCGARLVIGHCRALAAKFQSTRPVWGATGLALCFATLSRFQSTRPVWGATESLFFADVVDVISIHAPRVGRDIWSINSLSVPLTFQSTRPVWGATSKRLIFRYLPPAFQSTRPVWGATPDCFSRSNSFTFQSTRPVWGATQPSRRS